MCAYGIFCYLPIRRQPTNKTLKERYESYLIALEKQRKQLYILIRSAQDDPNADSNEIDRYLNLLNDINQVAITVKQVLEKLNEKP